MSNKFSGPAFSRRQMLLASAAITGAGALAASPARAVVPVTEGFLADLPYRLSAIETVVEHKRKELGVPGCALALVIDDTVVMLRGFGSRDAEGALPVTHDTLFAIGSDTKGFTATAAVMSAEEGKLSLADSPKKYLPYFKLQDPEADAAITIRDLLMHNSGLMRTDLTWISGALTREETIRIAALAKPTAKFRAAFQYQNTMYVAAGEATARAHGTTWESLIERRIFAPLDMLASTTSIAAMRRMPDFATGYNKVDGKLVAAKDVDRSNIAGAGAITSNAKDMAQWLRFLLGGGEIDGNRLISAEGFADMTRKHIAAGMVGYGLGFMVGRRGRYKTVFHGGNIDGFHSHVFFAPGLRLGFVLLSNIGNSPLPAAIENAIWANLVENSPTPIATETANPRTEVGRYAAQGVSAEVLFRDDKLFARFHGQPDYPLQPIEGRRYRFGAPAPDGFFITFRPSTAQQGQNEVLLEQPHGDLVMTRLKPANPNGGLSDAERELLGAYELNSVKIEIEQRGDFALVLIPGQHPYTLIEKEKDLFAFAELPDTYRLAAAREGEGKLTGIVFRQPQGNFAARRVAAPATAPDITVDALMANMIAAIGGEENLRRHRSLRAFAEMELENLGLTGKGITTALASDSRVSTIELFGLGKQVASLRNACEGNVSHVEMSFDAGVHTGSCSSDLDHVSLLNWKTRWTSVALERKTKLDEEEVYVLVKTAKDLRETDTISSKTFLVLQRETDAIVEGVPQRVATERFSDYRSIKGVLMPMQSHAKHLLLGGMTTRITDVKFDGGEGA